MQAANRAIEPQAARHATDSPLTPSQRLPTQALQNVHRQVKRIQIRGAPCPNTRRAQSVTFGVPGRTVDLASSRSKSLSIDVWMVNDVYARSSNPRRTDDTTVRERERD